MQEVKDRVKRLKETFKVGYKKITEVTDVKIKDQQCYILTEQIGKKTTENIVFMSGQLIYVIRKYFQPQDCINFPEEFENIKNGERYIYLVEADKETETLIANDYISVKEYTFDIKNKIVCSKTYLRNDLKGELDMDFLGKYVLYSVTNWIR